MVFDLNEVKKRMEGGVTAFKHEMAGLRTNRASTSMLDHVQVEVYGSHMPIAQVGTVGAPEARLLTVQVWDKANVKAVEKAIANAGLGLNPQADGQLIRVPLPDLSEERRKELVKIAHKYAENARVAVRNVRRDGMEAVKKLQKDGKLSEDAAKGESDKVQVETDKHIAQIDDHLKVKEKEILQV
jgi:ribosome recycling factor